MRVAVAEAKELAPALDGGHYEGTSKAGLPISFDVVVDPASGRDVVTNLATEVETECTWFGPENADPGIASQVVSISGLSGEVSRTGSVNVIYEPDEETLYEIDGTLLTGQADLGVSVEGEFDADGRPAAGSDLVCANFTEPYSARRVAAT